MNELEKAEKALFELTQEVARLRQEAEPRPVKNYVFQGTEGEVTLDDLFGSNDGLFLIHNMGQGCRFCTLWADGLNGFVSHLESRFSLALVSKDSPEIQRQMANSRGWRFRMVSHGGGEYIKEQSVQEGVNNVPGLVFYAREGGSIMRRNSVVFGPGDEFCSMWNILSLAGIGEESWIPQYQYWKRPEKMDDGGENLN